MPKNKLRERSDSSFSNSFAAGITKIDCLRLFFCWLNDIAAAARNPLSQASFALRVFWALAFMAGGLHSLVALRVGDFFRRRAKEIRIKFFEILDTDIKRLLNRCANDFAVADLERRFCRL